MLNRIVGIFTAALTFTLLVTSCSSPPEEKKEATTVAAKTAATVAPLENDHLLSVNNAVLLIKNYLDTINNSENAEALRKLPVGGSISAEALKRMTEENPDANGYMFYGFNDAEPATLFKEAKMLAACKFNFNPDSMVSYETNDATNVYLINDTVKHTFNSLTSEAITNYLSQFNKVIPSAASVYHYSNIKGNMSQYTSFFNENFGDGTVQWPYALFSSDEFLTRLYEATEGESNFGGIRYYFGLDKEAKENKLRIIIFAVTKSGTNVVVDNKILERHWPPSS